MTRIAIDILYGSSCVGDDDRARAEAAALSVLDAAGTTPAIAFAEFRRQWEECDGYDLLTGLGATWAAAEAAACRALTDGWHNPEGAACGISA